MWCNCPNLEPFSKSNDREETASIQRLLRRSGLNPEPLSSSRPTLPLRRVSHRCEYYVCNHIGEGTGPNQPKYIIHTNTNHDDLPSLRLASTHSEPLHHNSLNFDSIVTLYPTNISTYYRYLTLGNKTYNLYIYGTLVSTGLQQSTSCNFNGGRE